MYIYTLLFNKINLYATIYRIKTKIIQKGFDNMSTFKEISPNEISANPFELIGEQWALITAADGDGCNPMTASWGGVGIMWNRPVVFAFIRPQRYTHGLVENGDHYTLSFYPEKYRAALRLCGTKSGRDINKAQACGLTPVYDEAAPYFEEAELVLVCRKLYAQDMNEESAAAREVVIPNYSGNDWHTMYIGEIIKVLKK